MAAVVRHLQICEPMIEDTSFAQDHDLSTAFINIQPRRPLDPSHAGADEAVMKACRTLAQELAPSTNESRIHQGVRWAAIAQLLQATMTGNQDPCLYEFDKANGHAIGPDAGFLQRAIDEEVTQLIDTGRGPASAIEALHAAQGIVNMLLPKSAYQEG